MFKILERKETTLEQWAKHLDGWMEGRREGGGKMEGRRKSWRENGRETKEKGSKIKLRKESKTTKKDKEKEDNLKEGKEKEGREISEGGNKR